ncbi:AraC family transcriptional regulator [Pendulispora brunnea]|uniref:AraC family transcriptional regulator n=1 Tax=Pendulispora brunnea TaxID=2905690 RepID=A0ABZ2KAX2_9BACT
MGSLDIDHSIGGFRVAQADGTPPAVTIDGDPPGKSGIHVRRLRFAGGAHYRGELPQHVFFLQLDTPARLNCQLAGRQMDHVVLAGSATICPAGIDASAESSQGLEVLAITISRERLALAAAQAYRPGANLVECFSIYDVALDGIAQMLASEASFGFGNGPLYWSSVADALVEHIVEQHMTRPAAAIRGMLTPAALLRVTEFIHANINQPLEVETLAGVAAQSRFHFSRVFARSVGVSPHRYVMQLRLQRARDLLRDGRKTLSEVAYATGFVDQSHLTRWSQKIYGVPPGRLRR